MYASSGGSNETVYMNRLTRVLASRPRDVLPQAFPLGFPYAYSIIACDKMRVSGNEASTSFGMKEGNDVYRNYLKLCKEIFYVFAVQFSGVGHVVLISGIEFTEERLLSPLSFALSPLVGALLLSGVDGTCK